jgi:CheY-like chemotaxis protein
MGPPRPLSVLIVDDHADGADTLAALLQAVGHTVVTARNGPAALATAARWPPDVVVIEPGLPGQDGYAIVKQIRNALRRRPLLIALTGLSNLEDRSRAEGFDHHFVKPADPAALLSALAVHAARQASGPLSRPCRGRQQGPPGGAKEESLAAGEEESSGGIVLPE